MGSCSLKAQSVKNHLQCRRSQFTSWVGKTCWRRENLSTPVFLGFPCGSVGKESAYNVGRPEFSPRVGKVPWRRDWLPTPAFCLENSMDYIVRAVAKNQTRLHDFHVTSLQVCVLLTVPRCWVIVAL